MATPWHFSTSVARFCAALGFFWTASYPLMSAARQHVLAVTGDALTGAPGLRMVETAAPTLNDASVVAARASLQQELGGVTAGNDQAVWKLAGGSRTLVAREGTVVAPGGGLFAAFHAASIDDVGNVSLRATLSADQQGLWRFSSIGAGTVVARTDTVSVPEVPEAQFETIGFPLLHSAGGVIVYDGKMIQGPGDVHNLNARGVWVDDSGAAALLARQQMTAPGVPGGRFASIGATSVSNSAHATVIGSLELGSAGITFGNSRGIWRLGVGSGEMIARSGSLGVAGVAGASFNTFDDPAINGSGHVAFSATLVTQGSVTSANNRGVWRHHGAGSDLLLRTGVGGVPAVPGGVLMEVETPLLNDAGHVLVAGTMEPGVGGVSGADNAGLWILEPGQGALVARTGSGGVPGVGAAHFADFGNLAFNQRGVVAVQAELAAGAGGVGEENKHGIWLLDAAGEGQLVARTGEVVDGRTIASLEFRGGSGGGDGRQRSLNSHGQLAYKATFTNGHEAVVLYTPDLAWRGGASTAWDDAANWTLGLPPAEVHDVDIAPGAAAAIAGSATSQSVRSLTLGAGAGTASLQLTAGTTLTVTDGCEIGGNGILSGQGVLGATLTNRGEVAPGASAGRLAIGGNYVQDSAGVLSIEIGGANNSDPLQPQHDQLIVGGHADLGGTLAVTLINGFTPSIGDAFSVLTATGGFTAFDSIELPVLPAGRSWQSAAVGNSLVLNVVGSSTATADFDGDGDVDGGDLTRWKNNFGLRPGANQSHGSADGDGDVDGADFLAWQRQLGGGQSPSISAVPEPDTVVLVLVAGVVATACRRRRAHCLAANPALV